MTTDTETILQELKAIRSDLSFIKEHLPNGDDVLTEDDKEALEEAREDHRKGQSTSVEDFEKENAS